MNHNKKPHVLSGILVVMLVVSLFYVGMVSQPSSEGIERVSGMVVTAESEQTLTKEQFKNHMNIKGNVGYRYQLSDGRIVYTTNPPKDNYWHNVPKGPTKLDFYFKYINIDGKKIKFESRENFDDSKPTGLSGDDHYITLDKFLDYIDQKSKNDNLFVGEIPIDGSFDSGKLSRSADSASKQSGTVPDLNQGAWYETDLSKAIDRVNQNGENMFLVLNENKEQLWVNQQFLDKNENLEVVAKMWRNDEGAIKYTRLKHEYQGHDKIIKEGTEIVSQKSKAAAPKPPDDNKDTGVGMYTGNFVGGEEWAAKKLKENEGVPIYFTEDYQDGYGFFDRDVKGFIVTEQFVRKGEWVYGYGKDENDNIVYAKIPANDLNKPRGIFATKEVKNWKDQEGGIEMTSAEVQEIFGTVVVTRVPQKKASATQPHEKSTAQVIDKTSTPISMSAPDYYTFTGDELRENENAGNYEWALEKMKEGYVVHFDDNVEISSELSYFIGDVKGLTASESYTINEDKTQIIGYSRDKNVYGSLPIIDEKAFIDYEVHNWGKIENGGLVETTKGEELFMQGYNTPPTISSGEAFDRALLYGPVYKYTDPDTDKEVITRIPPSGSIDYYERYTKESYTYHPEFEGSISKETIVEGGGHGFVSSETVNGDELKKELFPSVTSKVAPENVQATGKYLDKVVYKIGSVWYETRDPNDLSDDKPLDRRAYQDIVVDSTATVKYGTIPGTTLPYDDMEYKVLQEDGVWYYVDADGKKGREVEQSLLSSILLEGDTTRSKYDSPPDPKHGEKWTDHFGIKKVWSEPLDAWVEPSEKYMTGTFYGKHNRKDMKVYSPDGGITWFNAETNEELDKSLINQIGDVKDSTEEHKRKQRQQKIANAISRFQSAYSLGSKFGGWGGLFLGDDGLDEWREAVDEKFAKYLGLDYWLSEFCANQELSDWDQEGVAFMNTAGGFSSVAAHVEATRGHPLTNATDTVYLYKITYSVKNGDYEHDPNGIKEMEFNVVLYGSRTVKLYAKYQELDKGDSKSISRQNPYVQYSPHLYTKICIEFEDDLPSSWQIDGKEVCKAIAAPPGTPQGYTEEKISTAGTPSESASVGSVGGQAVREDGTLAI